LFLYYITDRSQLSAKHEEAIRLLLERIAEAASAGVDAIQLREKDLNARELAELGTRAVDIVRGVSIGASNVRTRLLINSRLDVAIACGADGVHLRSDDVSAAEARVIFAQVGISSPFIGVSCHTVQEVSLAEGQGADFAVFGPVFEKARDKGAPTAVRAVKEACDKRKAAHQPMPVFVLGGVTLSNAANCLKAGARGVAGIRVFQNGNMSETVARLRKLGEELHS